MHLPVHPDIYRLSISVPRVTVSFRRINSVFFNRTDLIDKPTGINRIPFRSLIKPLFRALSNSGYREGSGGGGGGGGSGEQRTRTILIVEVHGLCLCCCVELCLHWLQ